MTCEVGSMAQGRRPLCAGIIHTSDFCLLALNFILCIWVFCWYVYTYNTHVLGAGRVLKKALDPLESERQIVVNHYVDAGN